MEDVPGTLLGILPCWRLFPETVRGSAQLIRFFGASDSCSSFNLEFFTHRPCSSPHCLAVTPVEPALPSSRFYTQLVSSVQEDVHTQLPLQTSLLLQAGSGPDSPMATLPELPVHFFGMLCK